MEDMGNYGYTLFRTIPFFINFLHALFRGKNRAVCAQKLCIAVTQNNNNKFK